MYDVVVVGGGIGGLTVAALLSARGMKSVCLKDNRRWADVLRGLSFPAMTSNREWVCTLRLARVEFMKDCSHKLPVDAA